MVKLAKQLNIDPQGGCFYFPFNKKKIAKTLEYTDFINLDLDKKGSLVGIEFIGVKK